MVLGREVEGNTMIFILEGADGTGKSTLAKAIAKETSAHIYHCGFGPEWDIEEYHKTIWRQVKAMERLVGNVVLDRFCISEIIYATCFRDGPAYDVEKFIYENIWEDEVKWIYTRNDNAVTNHVKNSKNRIEMFENMEDVTNTYESYISSSNLNWITYDFDKVNINDFVKEITR
jgi:thymidylate kinase